MSARFLHTSDWQLGVTRRFLSEESQSLWSAARLDSIRALGRLADTEKCEFVVVAGDVFETNQVDRRTVVRACEVLSAFSVPVFLLPGNHDPLDAASVFRSAAWKDSKPKHVHVLEEPGRLLEVRPGLQVVGAPWTSKRPLRDLVAAVTAELSPYSGVRVLAAHGAVDSLSPDPSNPALIRVAAAEESLTEGRIHYLALGDRHSLTKIGDTGRIWYSGTPEAYDFDEVDPGHVLVVEIGDSATHASAHQVGSWQFLRQQFDLSGTPDIEALTQWVDSLPNKARTVMKLGLVGTLTIRQRALLEVTLDRARDLLAAVVDSETRSELSVTPDDSDFADLALSGFAKTAVSELRLASEAGGPEAVAARDALGLLVRLVGRDS